MNEEAVKIVCGRPPAGFPDMSRMCGGTPTWNTDGTYLCMKRFTYCVPRVTTPKIHSSFDVPSHIANVNDSCI